MKIPDWIRAVALWPLVRATNTTNAILLPAPDRFTRGDGRRFHFRAIGDEYEVYSPGLEQWARCDSALHARMVSDALEQFYANAANHARSTNYENTK